MTTDKFWGMPVTASHLVPVDSVMFAEQVEDIPEEIGRSLSEQDDRFWSAVVTRRPFTWQGFLNWWIARRYVEPRDIRRR